MSGGLIGPEYDAQIREVIRERQRNRRTSRESVDMPNTRPGSRFPDKGVILDEALSVATNSKTGAASAIATVLEWSVADEEYIETDEQQQVWNHSESKSFAEDTFGFARMINGHWVFFGDCEPMAAR
jgi:hypothetical protein